MIENIYKSVRNNLRSNGKAIISNIKNNYFDPWDFAGEPDVCPFCGSNNSLTREHVLPQWTFQSDPDRYFETKINASTQTFIKTVIPVCSKCNNETLSKIEKYINLLFRNTDLSTDYFEYEESLNIIRWLEIIEYKFHVLEFRRKYIRNHSADFVPFLKDVPMSVMRLNINLSPYKALSQLRKAQARVIRKDKEPRYYSMVIWRSKNTQPLFFHTMDEHIFFEFPEYQMAMFYFFNKEFSSNYDAESEAKRIILKNYG